MSPSLASVQSVYKQRSIFLSTFVPQWSLTGINQSHEGGSSSEKSDPFVAVPIRLAGRCLLRIQMPSTANMQLLLWIHNGKPSGPELPTGNKRRVNIKKSKEAEEEAEKDAVSYSRAPA